MQFWNSKPPDPTVAFPQCIASIGQCPCCWEQGWRTSHHGGHPSCGAHDPGSHESSHEWEFSAHRCCTMFILCHTPPIGRLGLEAKNGLRILEAAVHDKIESTGCWGKIN